MNDKREIRFSFSAALMLLALVIAIAGVIFELSEINDSLRAIAASRPERSVSP